jgi:iron complex transport system ATP-binding protein
MTPAFVVRDLSITYPAAPTPALVDLSLQIPRASLFALIGPNGSGKSTLIRALLGALAPTTGTVLYEQRSVSEWTRRDLARSIGAVTQLEEMPFPVTVRELVAMGRYPHLGALRPEGEADRQAIEHALQRCDVATFARRSVATLSGGERQRTRIARALAQEPRTLVLDEPTVALDVGHEMAVFELLRSLSRDEGCTVVVATHQLNLAARYADTLLLLDRGRAAAIGAPAVVMRKTVLEAVYGWPVIIHHHTGTGFDSGAPQVAPLSQTSEVEP